MAKSPNFFVKFFASLFGSHDPEAEKKRKLKLIAKSLSKAKFHFYKNDEVQPSLAKFFYEIYRAIFPAKAMFMAQENAKRIKSLVITYSLSEEQIGIIDSLSEEAIKDAVKNAPIKKVKEQIQTDIEKMLAIFTTEKIARIESLYRKMAMFRAFCIYDFYYLLKKFDSSLREGNFDTPPKFEKINAEYLGDDLKDFIAVSYIFPEKEDWSDLIKFFKDTKGSEPVTLNVWNKILNRVNAVKNSHALDMLIQVITKDPDYFPDYSFNEAPIVDDYIEKIRSEAENTINSLVAAQQNNKIDGLLNQIFGTTSIERLSNYTILNSATYERKNLGAFEYVAPLNYYKAFLLDFVKKDVREFCDLVLVRGTWANQALSIPMSNAYHDLMESSNELLAFDAKIAEDADVGMRLKTHLPRAERDKEARNIIGTLIGDLNNEAKAICKSGAKNLIVIAKTTKNLIEDYLRPNGEVIINWKELGHFADHSIKDLGVGVYQNIYLFVNLMQSCLG